jgi:hypothetical protein
VACQFPIVHDAESAFRFALEAELAGADFAAAAEVIAPDERWREKLEELTCTHDDRLQKLRARETALDAAGSASWRGFDVAASASVLEAEPATGWPAAAEQMAAVEDAIAAYHDAFAARAGDALGTDARLFAKAGEQARAAADELRAMLG